MKPESSLLRLPESATGHHPESAGSSPYPNILFP